MNKTKDYILSLIVIIGFTAAGFLFGLQCSSKQPRKLTKFESCMKGINNTEGSWSLFGDITITRPDSAAIAQCVEVGKMEIRETLISKHGKENKRQELTKGAKQKLQYISEGVPKKVSWD